MRDTIPAVCIHTVVNGEPTLAGFYRQDGVSGLFTYDRDYLELPSAYPLDPVNLPLTPRLFRSPPGRRTFGFIEDSCAERWGSLVMASLGGAGARIPEDAPDATHRRLLSANGLGVGSIRFTRSPDAGPAELNPANVSDEMYHVGTTQDIARLTVIVGAIEQSLPVPGWSSRYLRPGMQFGGSRPKLLITAAGDTWIAKFASAQDNFNIPAIEYGVNLLAIEAGLRTTDTCIEQVPRGVDRSSVFMSRRFDRDYDLAPIHYLSFATVLGAMRTGSNAMQSSGPAGASYAAMARVLAQHSSAPEEDQKELFRRMVFNIIVGNRDDHLCNHGLLKDRQGQLYRLAPAFDLALDPQFSTSTNQQLGVGPWGRRATLTNALAGCADFSLEVDEAIEVIGQVGRAVSHWRETFALSEASAADIAWAGKVIMEAIDTRVTEASRVAARSELGVPRINAA